VRNAVFWGGAAGKTGGPLVLEHDTSHPEEFLFPHGKAFLLYANPWDAHKVI